MEINQANGSTQSASAAKQTGAPNALGQDAFLRILVTQMQHQDPMEPLKDTEFIGQMAQFSSLEQLTNLNKTMTAFAGGGQGNRTLADYAHLIGTSIQWSHEGQNGTGNVKAISSKNGEMMIEMEQEGVKVPISSILRIEKQDPSNEQEIV